MLEVFNKLYSSKASRQVVEFPLSVRTADEASDYCHEIMYRDLCKLGYKCGAPNRIEDPLLFDAFKIALFAAVDSIHKAGVIHCDLYISNVMWKSSPPPTSSSGPSTKYIVDIKIIDWDAAHCLEEGQFAPMVHSALQEYFKEHVELTDGVKFGVELDLCYLRVLDKDMCEENEQYWENLSSDIKEDMNFGYKKLLFQS